MDPCRKVVDDKVKCGFEGVATAVYRCLGEFYNHTPSIMINHTPFNNNHTPSNNNTESPFQSDALLVPGLCLFDHIHNASSCWDSKQWNATAYKSCSLRKYTLKSFAVLLPCGVGLFTGVEFVCCPPIIQPTTPIQNDYDDDYDDYYFDCETFFVEIVTLFLHLFFDSNHTPYNNDHTPNNYNYKGSLFFPTKKHGKRAFFF